MIQIDSVGNVTGTNVTMVVSPTPQEKQATAKLKFQKEQIARMQVFTHGINDILKDIHIHPSDNVYQGLFLNMLDNCEGAYHDGIYAAVEAK